MLRYAPYALGVVFLVGATWWQARIVDRWGTTGISSTELQQRFGEVPREIGNWIGTDLEVDEQVKETAGAVAHVNRIYKNEETGEEVALWLIAGHAKDIVRHTPDICYPAQGYRRARNEITFDVPTQDGSQATFWTAVYSPEEDVTAGTRRVFWAWSIRPTEGEDPKWRAPSSPRRTFRNTSSLFKMYFTSVVTNRDETAADSPCIDFARICIPQVNEAVFGERPQPSDQAATASADSETAPSESDAA